MKSKKINRRQALKNVSLGIGALSIPASVWSCNTHGKDKDIMAEAVIPVKGAIHHAACRWCYENIPLPEFAKRGKEIGLKAIDLLKPNEWEIAKKYGLECSLATDTFASITQGFNNIQNHQQLQQHYVELISKASAYGIKQVIVFSGNRNGISDTQGWEACAKGLDPLVKHAEQKNVTLVMELLNSKVDHIDYQCDHTKWGVSLVDKIGSPHFKLLYDIYHMQIMEGNIIATIQKYHEYFAHYHTGGVPGRNEINDSQELYYPAIIKAILDTGFNGYVAQEFIPTYDDALLALQEGITICNVQRALNI
ncbi:TIM barrel protein [Aquimarina sp. U1-2]|uniref:hydroxypyruvate isomerase family protein n=1 Tax=Aquimarina sp. U1-2 TaxID=2823141 RepID=UPI001AECEF57|nr:TIM barrel protein [Aquimarina sp. U1-2]MBP2833654.1 TIM barrel protein [Aquimarina sp. U1-2]